MHRAREFNFGTTGQTQTKASADCRWTPKHQEIVRRDSTAVGFGGRSEEFLSLYMPREENPNRSELTRTARSAEGARVWSELFVRDTLLEQTTSLNEDPSSPNNAVVRNKTTVQNSVGIGVQSAGAGMQSVGVGVQNSAGVGVQNNVNVGVHSTSVGVQSVGVGVQNSASVAVSNNVGIAMSNSAGVAILNSARTQNQVIMAGPKKKLPKFDGDRTANPIRHCETRETIWTTNGITDTDE